MWSHHPGSWRTVNQQLVFKTALLVWKCVCGVALTYLTDLCIPTTATAGRQHLRLRLELWWFCVPGPQLDSRVSPLTDRVYLKQSAACTTVTRLDTERLQAFTKDVFVLKRRTSLRRFRDSGAGYKCSNLLSYTYLLLKNKLEPVTGILSETCRG